MTPVKLEPKKPNALAGYEGRGNFNCKKYDLVTKQIDADCRQLDSKLCDLIYLLVALIFCHIWRSI